jgi:hypothetical protein
MCDTWENINKTINDIIKSKTGFRTLSYTPLFIYLFLVRKSQNRKFFNNPQNRESENFLGVPVC